jgi:hypothetical protein
LIASLEGVDERGFHKVVDAFGRDVLNGWAGSAVPECGPAVEERSDRRPTNTNRYEFDRPADAELAGCDVAADAAVANPELGGGGSEREMYVGAFVRMSD